MKDWSGCIWTRSTYKISRIKTQAFQTLRKRWLAKVTCLSSVSLEKLLSRCSQNAPIVKASGGPFPLECDGKVNVGKRGHLAKEFLQWMTLSAYMRNGLRKFFSNVLKVSTKIIIPLPLPFLSPSPTFSPMCYALITSISFLTPIKLMAPFPWLLLVHIHTHTYKCISVEIRPAESV